MIKATNPDQWFRCPYPSSQARVRLFCFPYAGGGAAVFRSWPQTMPPAVEVRILRLPGRESRIGEKPFRSFLPLVDAVTKTLAHSLDQPFAFFGHSMGALIAFEAARSLRARYSVEPVHLFVSGCPAPQTIRSRAASCHWSDREFVAELRRLNGTPAAVLENQEVLDLVLPVLRADFAVCDSYRYAEAAPLSCPITAFGGRLDPQVSAAQLTEWRHQTNGFFRQAMFPGDHFFLHEAYDPLIRTIFHLLSERDHARSLLPTQPAPVLSRSFARQLSVPA